MRVGVVGTGYVGLVVGACLADAGNDVICADVDESKIARLKQNEIPIYEPGLEELVVRNQADGRLRFTTDVGECVRGSDIIFIAVGTPPGEDGSADLKHVLDVAATVGRNMDGEKIVITKSTVPVGTAAKVKAEIGQYSSLPVHVCSNPEFLKEGAAVDDFMKPDRVVIGTDSDYARSVLTELYAPFVRTGNPILFMDVASAEITKYAANAMLATRISFMNMIAALCDAIGANVDDVRKGVGSDPRIGNSFLFPGCGYGGSCFPKDVKALIRTLEDLEIDAGILKAVEDVNERQKRLLLDHLDDRLGRDLSGVTVAVWGLSFKPETDDMREAPSIEVVNGLVERGATVRAHDPVAMDAARAVFGDRITYVDVNYDALPGASALLILTDWKQYRSPAFNRMKALMQRPLVLDGRNLYEPVRMGEMGFEYVSVGRRAADPAVHAM
ncbi:MAG: UDP-glucose/GDP-mannose dehydrogenase family protein [Candidatus Cloacimonetes bacterium]|nr:UDP-glucose/GDP-mannose dehydrogenase family protein [Candidatus Cloacimonadota bacterium]